MGVAPIGLTTAVLSQCAWLGHGVIRFKARAAEVSGSESDP